MTMLPPLLVRTFLGALQAGGAIPPVVSTMDWAGQHLVGYAGVALSSYVVSAIQFSRREKRRESRQVARMDTMEKALTTLITNSESAMKTHITRLEEKHRDRIEAVEGESRSLAQEMWGAQRNNGMRGDVKAIQAEIGQHGRMLAEILSELRRKATAP